MTKLQFAIVATDILIVRMKDKTVEVAIQPVHRPPHYINMNAFIGGIVKPEETSEVAAGRIIHEKTGLDRKQIFLTPLKFYDGLSRDKRGRVISIGYIGIMNSVAPSTHETRWVPLHHKEHYAYDHNEMLLDMQEYMKHHLYTTTIALRFMPKEFTIATLQTLYEYLLGKVVDKRNFYKFVEELPIESTGVRTTEGRGRPAMLYKKLPKADKEFYLS